MPFTHTLWVNSGKSKQEEKNQQTLHFGNAIYRVLHEQSNITGSFAEHVEVQKNLTFTHALWIKSDKSK